MNNLKYEDHDKQKLGISQVEQNIIEKKTHKYDVILIQIFQ